MVLKQENVNTDTMKNDGIDASFINSQEGEDNKHGNSLFEDLSETKMNINSAINAYVPPYTFLSQRSLSLLLQNNTNGIPFNLPLLYIYIYIYIYTPISP